MTEKKLLSKHLIRLAGLVSWSQNQLLYQTRMSDLGSEAWVMSPTHQQEWMKWCLVLTLEPRTTIHLAFTELSRGVPPDTRILHSSQHTRFNDSIMSEYVPVLSQFLIWPTISAPLQTCPWILPRPSRISLNPSGSHHPIVPTIRPEWHLAAKHGKAFNYSNMDLRCETVGDLFSLPSLQRLQSQFESGCHIAKHRSWQEVVASRSASRRSWPMIKLESKEKHSSEPGPRTSNHSIDFFHNNRNDCTIM